MNNNITSIILFYTNLSIITKHMNCVKIKALIIVLLTKLNNASDNLKKITIVNTSETKCVKQLKPLYVT